MPYLHYFSYQDCLTRPIVSSAVFGTIFAGLDVVQGAKFTPQRVLVYSGGLYVYNALQCPMEAIHGRPSLSHNMIAGGLLGYVGVGAGQLGIPFVGPETFYRYPWMRPQMVAFGVYGGLAGVMAALGGKPL